MYCSQGSGDGEKPHREEIEIGAGLSDEYDEYLSDDEDEEIDMMIFEMCDDYADLSVW